MLLGQMLQADELKMPWRELCIKRVQAIPYVKSRGAHSEAMYQSYHSTFVPVFLSAYECLLGPTDS